MNNPFVIVLIIVFFLVSTILNKRIIEYRRNKMRNVPFPLNWSLLLNKEVKLYRTLPQNLKLELNEHLKVFLAEKKFVGKNGLIVTQEMKLIIAAQACILLLGDRDNQRNYFPYLKYIHLYPNHIREENQRQRRAHLLLGQSSIGNKSGSDGVVSLSWKQITQELLFSNYDTNVILHEFAHQLDQEFGNATGMPRLKSLQDSLIWSEIFGREFNKHCLAVDKNQETIIDIYGATHPVEFFAVVTETFFMKASLLATNHPALYYLLKKYYGVDPVSWKISRRDSLQG